MAEQALPEKPKGDEPVEPRAGKGQRKREGVIPTQRIKGKQLHQSQKGKARAAARGGERMGKARPNTDQKGQIPPSEKEEGYVRFRIRVDDGQMSVVDMSLCRQHVNAATRIRR